MDEPKPRRPWWRRKRSIATVVALMAAAYLLSFFPACWALMRTEPDDHPIRWKTLRTVHWPTACALSVSPSAVRDPVFAVIGLGQPARGWKIYENWDGGLGVGMYRVE